MNKTNTIEGSRTPTEVSSDHKTEVSHPDDVPVNLPNEEHYKQVPGWGVDIDRDNDPTYSMKPDRTDDEKRGYTWDRPSQQPVNMEVLHSIERPNITAAFGDAPPPRGLSGMIRRAAYQYSESSLGRWLPLMLADRIDVLEGYVEDVSHGHIPNPFFERGWRAEWEHDRPRVMRKIAIGSLAAATIIALSCKRRNRC